MIFELVRNLNNSHPISPMKESLRVNPMADFGQLLLNRTHAECARALTIHPASNINMLRQPSAIGASYSIPSYASKALASEVYDR